MLVTAVVVGTAGAFTAARPAAAGHNLQDAGQVTLRYTDSLDVHASRTPHDDIPIGAWRDPDGKHHMSRVYATYDISNLAGKRLFTATLFARESQATDCVDRAIQVWTTAQAAAPTWADPPAETALAGTIGSTRYCPAYLRLDLTNVVQQALTAGQTTISVELRVPADQEGDLDIGRLLDNQSGVTLSIDYNNLPVVPTKLYNDGQACAGQAPGPYLSLHSAFAGPTLSALFQDYDQNDHLSGSFAVWPVDHPDQRTAFDAYVTNGRWGGAPVPAGALAGNTTYAWQASLNDGTDVSAWSTTCYFTTDATAPGPPAVSVSNYPQSDWADGGTPAHVTITANGTPDVAGFEYSWNDLPVVCVYTFGPRGEPQWTDPYAQPGMVRADTVGGTATVDLSPPVGGPNVLHVRSVDRACNVSEEASLRVYVRDTSPTITPSGTPTVGKPVTLTFTPHPAVTQVLSYTYRVNYGDVQTVTAGPDGSATVTVTPQDFGQFTVQAASHSDNGWVSPVATYWAYLDNAPTVTSDVYPDYYATGRGGGGVGVSGQFTFGSPLDGVVGYEYWIDWSESYTVPAASDGTATASWTPSTSGLHEVEVYAIDQNGSTLSDLGTYDFFVNDDA